METIGLAVFNGGLTTFLALTLCGGSTSHTFVTFFKVFVLTVLFGLYHGLVLLPVLLSLCGPVTQIQENSIAPEIQNVKTLEKEGILESIQWVNSPIKINS